MTQDPDKSSKVNSMLRILQVAKHFRLCALTALMIGLPLRLYATTATDNPSQGQAPLRFDVWEFRVLGNTSLPVRDIEKLLYGYLGKDKGLEDLENARQALEALFKERGFATTFVDLPEQDVDEGIVRLKATEGTVGHVRVTGARLHSGRRMLELLPAVSQGQVMNVNALRGQLDDINRTSPDRIVTPVLRAGKIPGKIDVDLRMEERLPLHGSVEVNDRYTQNTSRWRGSATVSYDNVAQRYDSLSLYYQTAPEHMSDAKVISASYLWRLDGWRNQLALYYVDSDSQVQPLTTLGVIGKGKIFGVRDVIALPSSDAFSQNLSCGVDFKNYKETVSIAPDSQSGSDAVTVSTPIKYLNWTCQWNGGVAKAIAGGPASFNLGISFGMRSLLNHDEDFENKRFKARANYFLWRGSVTQVFPLPAKFSLATTLEGQLALEPLITNEQFSVGGMDSVRGYTESQQLGDYGYRGSLEFRTPTLGAGAWPQVQELYFLLFTDYAEEFVRDPLPSQRSSFQLFSAGAGLRMALFRHLSGQVYWARALRDNGSVADGSSRWHVLLKFGF